MNQPIAHVVVIEDDQSVREMLAAVLEAEGYRTTTFVDAETALADPATDECELVVLDVGLPGADGIEACMRLRNRGRRRPVLMLTARHEHADRVVGLDAGADDYLVKPFALAELFARVRALLRRAVPAAAQPETVAVIGDLNVDPAARTVVRAQRPIEMTRREFDLLHLLVSRAPAVVTRDEIHDQIWGHDDEHFSNSLEVFISQLRRKTEIDGAPRVVHTVRGIGYVARLDGAAEAFEV